jgi:hypothetical protein
LPTRAARFLLQFLRLAAQGRPLSPRIQKEKHLVNEANLAVLYTGRRQRLAEQIKEGLALISSPGVAPDPFLFDRNLPYLTGLDSRKAILVLAPGDMTVDR